MFGRPTAEVSRSRVVASSGVFVSTFVASSRVHSSCVHLSLVVLYYGAESLRKCVHDLPRCCLVWLCFATLLLTFAKFSHRHQSRRRFAVGHSFRSVWPIVHVFQNIDNLIHVEERIRCQPFRCLFFDGAMMLRS
jgi:hypothetical protein